MITFSVHLFYFQANDKLGTLFSQMAVFILPLNFAYVYEHDQGPSHNRLASVLEMTSFFLNDTVSYIRRQVSVSLEKNLIVWYC